MNSESQNMTHSQMQRKKGVWFPEDESELAESRELGWRLSSDSPLVLPHLEKELPSMSNSAKKGILKTKRKDSDMRMLDEEQEVKM